jgi:hypothetical protein
MPLNKRKKKQERRTKKKKMNERQKITGKGAREDQMGCLYLSEVKLEFRIRFMGAVRENRTTQANRRWEITHHAKTAQQKEEKKRAAFFPLLLSLRTCFRAPSCRFATPHKQPAQQQPQGQCGFVCNHCRTCLIEMHRAASLARSDARLPTLTTC